MFGRATATLYNQVDIAVAPARVGKFFADFKNFTAIHPLMVAIVDRVPRPDVPDDPGALARKWYKVTDRLPCGPLTLHIRYDVALCAAGPQALRFEAWQWPRIHLHNRISWHGLPQGGTRVQEELALQAPGLLLPLVQRMAQAAHADSFARLKKRLEAEP